MGLYLYAHQRPLRQENTVPGAKTAEFSYLPEPYGRSRGVEAHLQDLPGHVREPPRREGEDGHEDHGRVRQELVKGDAVRAEQTRGRLCGQVGNVCGLQAAAATSPRNKLWGLRRAVCML
jgi:hypothetical protein